MKTLHFAEIDSTNTYLMNHYPELEHFTFVSADLQTAGKGRNSRKWLSENGSNLLFSFLIKERSFFAQYKAISIVSALSVLKVLERWGVKNAMIKWPNDIYAGERKICGILLQGVATDEMQCLIAGIGINVNQTVFEGDYRHAPTSVAAEIGHRVDMETFREAVFTQIEQDMILLNQGKDFYPEIAERDYLKGMSCFAEIDNERREVTVNGIAPDFRLEVIDGGKSRMVESGEISFH